MSKSEYDRQHPDPVGVKWQPVMLVLNRRLECRCGAMAVFVTGHQPERTTFSPYNLLDDVDCWCQVCFVHAQTADATEQEQDGGDRA